jgi:hypothetical protein
LGGEEEDKWRRGKKMLRGGLCPDVADRTSTVSLPCLYIWDSASPAPWIHALLITEGLPVPSYKSRTRVTPMTGATRDSRRSEKRMPVENMVWMEKERMLLKWPFQLDLLI